jgi:antitoxin component of RelBE/YafQ-DinJ toxin-antitoxin module
MSDTVVISVPVDERSKRAAEAVLARHGLTPAEFLSKAVNEIAQGDHDWLIPAITSEGELFDQLRLMLRQLAETIERHESLISEMISAGGHEETVESLRQSAKRLGATKDDLAQALDRLSAFMPNAETVAAMEAVERGEVKSFATIEELFADLHSDADD